MFRREVKNVRDLVMQSLRANGLETPLLQRRLIESWPSVAGEIAARYTTDCYIHNQILYVKMNNPALRADLSMRRSDLVIRLNHAVGSNIITDIRLG